MDQHIEPTDALRDLVPFLDAIDSNAFLSRIDTQNVLGSFYVFDVPSVAVPKDVDDLQPFIERHYRSVLSAAHHAGWSVLTAIVGSEFGVSVSLGFRRNEVVESESNPHYVFNRLLRGSLSGLNARLDLNNPKTAKAFFAEKYLSHGGVIAGVPTLRIDDERQYVSLPAVVRAMQGESYVLMLISNPVPERKLFGQMDAVGRMRDECHKMARRTVQRGKGGSESNSETLSATSSLSMGESKTIMIQKRVASISANYTRATSRQETIAQGRAEAVTTESNWSESLSAEEQDSVWLELERLCEYHWKRFGKAINVGAWETSITFATMTKQGRDILAGVLVGELAKPSTVWIPPRAYYENLTDMCPILLPRRDDVSTVFPSSFASYLTSEEVAALSAPPAENLPGYEVRRVPVLSLTDVSRDGAGNRARLGTVCEQGQPLKGVHVHLGPEDLVKHVFVCGLTGSGKTTTVKEMLAKADVPFLVLESAKRDYRKLIGCPDLEDRLRVFTLGDMSIAPLRLNPFHILPGIQAGVHIDYLKAIFNASFSLYGPMPYIVEQCLHNVYAKRGWDLTSGVHPQLVDMQSYQDAEARCYFPTVLDLADEVDSYVRFKLGYRGEISDNIRTAIVTRLRSLAVGAKGLLFNSSETIDMKDLLGNPTVLEFEALSDDDDKAFALGLLLTLISEYRQVNDANRDLQQDRSSALQHVLVIEEAHRLLKNVARERQTDQLGNPRGKAVDFFANVVSEMRSMGQGVVVVDQIPSKLVPDVIKNTNAKLVHRLVARDDQALLASTVGLEDHESRHFAALETGRAIYAKEGMQRPIEILVRNSVPSTRVADETVRVKMRVHVDDEVVTMAIRSALGRYGDAVAVRLLCTLACGEKSDAAGDVGRAIAEVGRLLLQRDHRHSESSIKKYLAIRIVELLANGVFCLAIGKTRRVTEIVQSAMDGDGKGEQGFRQRLAEGWDQDACEGVVQRVRELALDRVLRAGMSMDDADALRRIVTSYFVRDLWGVRQTITNQIKARLGGTGWNRRSM